MLPSYCVHSHPGGIWLAAHPARLQPQHLLFSMNKTMCACSTTNGSATQWCYKLCYMALLVYIFGGLPSPVRYSATCLALGPAPAAHCSASSPLSFTPASGHNFLRPPPFRLLSATFPLPLPIRARHAWFEPHAACCFHTFSPLPLMPSAHPLLPHQHSTPVPPCSFFAGISPTALPPLPRHTLILPSCHAAPPPALGGKPNKKQKNNQSTTRH